MAAQGRCGVKMVSLAFAILAIQANMAWAAIYNVGDRPATAPSWTLPPLTNYNTWASSKFFRANDMLRFSYATEIHNVMLVSKADYDSCNSAKPLAVYNNGATLIRLPKSGTYYFICGTPGHCEAGMKMQVTVH